MKVLHLFSNYKWTGPADPALGLCCQLRAMDVQTEFACAPDSGRFFNKVVASARERGMEPVLDFHLRKHRHPLKNFQDVRRLRRYLAEHAVDIVHCHLDNDHEIAARAVRGSAIPLVRTSYEGTGLVPDRRRRQMLARTTLLIEPSEMARTHDLAAYALRPEQVVVIPNAVDTARFDPSRPLSDARVRWGIPAGAYVVGIVARMQTHRHFEDLLQAMRGVVDVLPEAQLIIVGRGTHQEIVANEPVRRLGLETHVTFTGYVEADDYVAAIAAMDVGVYLVPGSDGTCRAAREILAMGKPLVVADRGMLREIVGDGSCGVVTDGSANGLRDALLALGRDETQCAESGKNARQTATTKYALDSQAAGVREAYVSLLQAVARR